MTIEGGCYCGEVRFAIEGDIRMRALCLCRTCQRISGGAGNLFIGLLAEDFRYVQGAPKVICLNEEVGPSREFCPTCGVHIAARSPKAQGGLVVKVGVLDDPSVFEGPGMVFWTEHKEVFHLLPPEVPTFPRHPVAPK